MLFLIDLQFWNVNGNVPWAWLWKRSWPYNGHEAIKYAQRSFMERFFKLISFGKCEKYANYREKFSFTRKVKVTCFCNSFVKSLTIFNLFKFTKSWQIGIGSQVNITETYNTPSQKNYMNNLNDGFINPPIKRIKRKITQIKPNVVFSIKYDKVAIFYSR